MVDVATFLTPLYVLVDDVAKVQPAAASPAAPGRPASRSAREVVTVALFAQWGRFPRERAFSR